MRRRRNRWIQKGPGADFETESSIIRFFESEVIIANEENINIMDSLRDRNMSVEA